MLSSPKSSSKLTWANSSAGSGKSRNALGMLTSIGYVLLGYLAVLSFFLSCSGTLAFCWRLFGGVLMLRHVFSSSEASWYGSADLGITCIGVNSTTDFFAFGWVAVVFGWFLAWVFGVLLLCVLSTSVLV